MDSPNTLLLDHYFPTDVLKLTEVFETDKIIIHMKAVSTQKVPTQKVPATNL
jgi:hypothetical protein